MDSGPCTDKQPRGSRYSKTQSGHGVLTGTEYLAGEEDSRDLSRQFRNPVCRCVAMTPYSLIWIQFLWMAPWPSVKPRGTGYMLTWLSLSHKSLLLALEDTQFSRLCTAAFLAASPRASLTSGACLPAPPLPYKQLTWLSLVLITPPHKCSVGTPLLGTVTARTDWTTSYLLCGKTLPFMTIDTPFSDEGLILEREDS